MVARGNVTWSSTSHWRRAGLHTRQYVSSNYIFNACIKVKTWSIVISAFTLTESSTDCANTSTAMPRLKKGCWVMSYILALKPPFSVREMKDQRFITQLEQNVSAEMFYFIIIIQSEWFSLIKSVNVWTTVAAAVVVWSQPMLKSVVVSLTVLQMALTDCLGVLINGIIVLQVSHTLYVCRCVCVKQTNMHVCILHSGVTVTSLASYWLLDSY